MDARRGEARRGEAVARGYDSIESCASYYNSSVSLYRLEARAIVAWRHAVNQQLEQLVLAPPAGIGDLGPSASAAAPAGGLRLARKGRAAT